jgi:hypothetical protein
MLAGCAALFPGPRGAEPTPVAPPPTPLIEWNAASGKLRCRSSELAIPEPLRGQVRWSTPHELTLLPAKSPPGGALVVTLMEAVDSDSPFRFLQDSPSLWVDLHVKAVGGEAGLNRGDAGTDAGAQDLLKIRGNLDMYGDHVVAEYDVGRSHGKVILLQVGRCRIRALDFPVSTTHPPITALVEELAGELDPDGGR